MCNFGATDGGLWFGFGVLLNIFLKNIDNSIILSTATTLKTKRSVK